MPIDDLRGIREAAEDYVKKVPCLISELIPAGGSQIGPNEKFTFSITAKNLDASQRSVGLCNVIYHVWVDNLAVCKLLVPPTPMEARDKLSTDPTSKILIPGTYVNGMYLYPADDKTVLWATNGENTLSLAGQAGSNPLGGTTPLHFEIFATVNVDWLFPHDRKSTDVQKPVTVIG